MKTTLMILQIIFALTLSLSILLQHRGSGLSATFGGSSSTFHTAKRGFEKFLARATIVLAILFVINTIGLFIARGL